MAAGLWRRLAESLGVGVTTANNFATQMLPAVLAGLHTEITWGQPGHPRETRQQRGREGCVGLSGVQDGCRE